MYPPATHSLDEHEKGASDNKEAFRMRDRLQFRAQLFHFLGEVEAVFGIWLIPLAIAILVMKSWSALTSYAAAIDAAEPIFVVVVMAMASSRPILRFAEACLAKVATLGRSPLKGNQSFLKHFLAKSAGHRIQCGDRLKVGGHAAERNRGYHRRNTVSSSLLSTFVRVCTPALHY
jgi:hypothetical protein